MLYMYGIMHMLKYVHTFQKIMYDLGLHAHTNYCIVIGCNIM